MWYPTTLAELDEALDDDAFREVSTIDFKAEAGKNGRKTAEDVAAMATDGGVLIYGIGEDDGKRPVKRPVDLHATEERIANQVNALVHGRVQMDSIWIRDPEDSSTGYLVVVVPKSLDGPHGVEYQDDGLVRFFRRELTSNRQLTAHEVDEQYQLRYLRQAQEDRERRDVIHRARTLLQADERGGYAVVVRPRVSDDALVARAFERKGAVQPQEYFTPILEAVKRGADLVVPSASGQRGVESVTEWAMGARSGWRGREVGQAARLTMQVDGSGTLVLCGRGWQADPLDRLTTIWDQRMASHVVQTLLVAGTIHQDARHLGDADITVIVTGVQGVTSAAPSIRGLYVDDESPQRGYPEPEYEGQCRATVQSLTTSAARVAHDLLHPFLRVTRRSERHGVIEVGSE